MLTKNNERKEGESNPKKVYDMHNWSTDGDAKNDRACPRKEKEKKRTREPVRSESAVRGVRLTN